MSRKKHTFVRINVYTPYSYNSVNEDDKIEYLIDISKYMGFTVFKDSCYRSRGNIAKYMTVYFDTHVEELKKFVIDMESFERLKQFVTEI
jgi:hypothetical protein